MRKSMFMSSVARGALGVMTANERRLGRYIRDGEGHPTAPAPAPAPAPAGGEGGGEGELQLTTEQALDAEFAESGDVAPATPEAGADANAIDDGDPNPDGDQGQPKEPAKPVQERIDELTGARREAERVAAEARREADYWRGKAEAVAPAPKGEGGERDPNAEPSAADYEFGEADPKFIGDTSRYHARQEFQSQQQAAELKGQIADMEAGWSTRIADPELVTQYPDFDEKVTKGAAEGKWDCSPIMALGIKNSEFGPDIAYHLATNTSEATRIAKLTPIEQAREFGRMEGERSATKKSAEQPKPKTATDAPEPPAGRARGAGGRFGAQADTDDFAAFDKLADGILKG